jgi:tetratricopeptide (TPR) repeat protein
MELKKAFLILLLLTFFSISGMSVETIPEWFLPFMDAVYEQTQSDTQITPMYKETKQRILQSYSGYRLYIVLSQCEYTMGMFFQFEGQNNEAAAFYEKGIDWAEKSLAENPSSEGYQMLAVNIALSCRVKPLSYILANGRDIVRYAKKALELDPENIVAQYLMAVQYIYAPAIFSNVRKGLQMLEEISAHNSLTIPQLSKEYRFNLYSSMAFAYNKLKNQEETRLWLNKALDVYPTNRYAEESLN